MSEISEKFNNFKANHLSKFSPEAQEKIYTIERGLKKALLAANLKDHDGLKMLIEKYQIEIKSINDRLVNERDLEDVDRLFLFERREWCQELISYFDFAEAKIESTKAFIEKAEANV